MKFTSYFKIIITVIFFSTIFLACSSMPQLQSERAAKPITIDGDKNDWGDRSTYIEDANISLMVSNDDQYLYLYASTTEKRGLLARGVTIWFDSTGGKDNYFGIHFPLGMKGKTGKLNQDEEGFPPSDEQGGESRNNQDESRKNRMRSFRNPISEMDKYEILGADEKDKRTFFLKDDSPIKLALKDNQFAISYEARIPLYMINNFKYAINPGSSKTISLGFEFGEMETSKRGRSGGPGGGMGGPGGGSPPDGGGMGGPSGGGSGGGMGGPGGGGPGGGGMGGRGGRGGQGGDRQGGGPSESADMDDFWIKVVLK